MSKNAFTLQEIQSRTGVPEETLERWLKQKWIKPAGFTDDRTPLFSEEAAARLENIVKLRELGFGADEIQKIIKKIGLPKSRPERSGDGNLDKHLTVGALAEKAGVSPRTIKHWEDKGIIEPDMRSEGGFRLYSKGYVHLCRLIQDLQLFGYSLEEIKAISDLSRDFLAFEERLVKFDGGEVDAKLRRMLDEIQALSAKMKLFRDGLDRWEDLLKKKKKDVLGLKSKNLKRTAKAGGGS